MATRNPLVGTVGLDDRQAAFCIKAAVTTTWYIVHPLNHPEQGTIMSLAEIKSTFHGFESEISYRNARRK